MNLFVDTVTNISTKTTDLVKGKAIDLIMSQAIFIPAGNEPSAVLARAFGECREGQIPRSSAAHQA